jgi:hypothetical protein
VDGHGAGASPLLAKETGKNCEDAKDATIYSMKKKIFTINSVGGILTSAH